MKNVTIHIARTIGGGICVAASDGHKIHDAIRSNILEKKRVTLSFENITRLTTAFLNAAVGQLYNEFSEDEIRQYMAPPIDADPRHLSRLKLVVDRAKEYFKNADQMDRNFSRVTGLKDDEDN